jgi:hypothetical protein
MYSKIKIGAVMLALVSLYGCGTVPMKVDYTPPGKTDEQRQLDDMQCSQASRVSGPWVYGIGSAIMNQMAKDRYTECMASKGYKVSPQ